MFYFQIFQHRINVAVAKAQAYLERQVSSMTDDYVLAITSYALKLANSSFFDVAFNKLNSHAILKGSQNFIFQINVLNIIS